MSRLILFCVEADRVSKSDYLYIREVIRHYYIDDKKVVYRPVYMKGKGNYKSKSVLSDIKEECEGFGGEISVIYCVDTDDYDTSVADIKLNQDIEKYCAKNGHDLILCCKDIEDVFLGKQIDKGEKTKEAEGFVRKMLIKSIDKKRLLAELPLSRHLSNMMLVLDMYFKRKD